MKPRVLTVIICVKLFQIIILVLFFIKNSPLILFHHSFIFVTNQTSNFIDIFSFSYSSNTEITRKTFFWIIFNLKIYFLCFGPFRLYCAFQNILIQPIAFLMYACITIITVNNLIEHIIICEKADRTAKLYIILIKSQIRNIFILKFHRLL
jgi:hypothetical protein